MWIGLDSANYSRLSDFFQLLYLKAHHSQFLADQYSCLENPTDGGGAGWATVHGVAKSQTRLSDFPFTFHFHALEKEMATHSSVLACRIPGTGEPGGLPSMGSHRVGHDWSDLAAAAVADHQTLFKDSFYDSISYWFSAQRVLGSSAWVWMTLYIKCQLDLYYMRHLDSIHLKF